MSLHRMQKHGMQLMYLVVFTFACFIAAYAFGGVNPPPVGAGNCTRSDCKECQYWWVNGDTGSEQCYYREDDDGTYSIGPVNYGLQNVWVLTVTANNGPGSEPIMLNRNDPSNLNRICNGATFSELEQCAAGEGNVDTYTMQFRTPKPICKVAN
jgi:hypothetical protein